MKAIKDPAQALQTALAERDAMRLELDRLRIHQDMLVAISGTIEIKALLALLGERILEIEAVDGVVMTALDRPGENLVTMHVRYPEEFRHLESTFLNYKYPLTSPSSHVTALAERCIQVLDSKTGSEQDRQVLSRWKLRQLAVWPVAAEGEAIGTVMVLCQGAPLPAASYGRVQKLIDIFSLPLWQAQRYEHLRQQKLAFETAATEQERFLRFVTEVNNLTLPERIYELIATELMNRLPFDIVAVFIEKDGLLECRKTVAKNEFFAPQAQAVHEYCQSDPYVVDIQDGGPPHCFIKNIPLVFNDVQQIMHLDLPRKSRTALELVGTTRTLINMPIRAKGKPIGVLMLSSLTEPVNLSEADFKFFELLSSFFGSAISNANTYALAEAQSREIGRLNLILQDKVDELADQVATDKLTGLFNFRTFEQELLRRVNEYQRNAAHIGLSIVMVDIDHFKHFNDKYGHAAGNVVLAGVANEVAKLSRKMDMACRYGGEEFVVILPKCEADGALIFAERVRVAVEKARFHIESGEELGVTVSVGVSTFVDGDSQQSLFERADQALYRAKRGGRNRISA